MEVGKEAFEHICKNLRIDMDQTLERFGVDPKHIRIRVTVGDGDHLPRCIERRYSTRELELIQEKD